MRAKKARPDAMHIPSSQDDPLVPLRAEIDRINLDLLDLVSARGRLVQQILSLKRARGIPAFDPARESAMLEALELHNQGPFSSPGIRHLFKEIFQASLDLGDEDQKRSLLVSRRHRPEDTILELGEGAVLLGGPHAALIAGPCAVESEEQLERVAAHVRRHGVRLLRGGVFKPRTSPYSFQGMRAGGLEILRDVARRHGMLTVTEVLDPRDVERVSAMADVLQVGARNMYNYELLREVGRGPRPVLLKRSFMATLEEFLLSAEYIRAEGNEQIVLCERGIRTFERWTRNTLDISAVPILQQESHLPVIVDISHAAGRTDVALPLARAAMAAGAQGVMVEVHPEPSVALSDGPQSLPFDAFDRLVDGLAPFLDAAASSMRGRS